jgi:mono/diheme cytochrome c family protein
MRAFLTLPLPLLVLLAASGCGRPTPHFVPRTDASALIPEAQEYVNQVLEQNFGTPTDSVLWERLPVRYHAAAGTVAAGPTADAVILNVAEQNLPIQPGDEVLWLSGPALQQPSGWIRSYDPETHAATFEEPVPTPPVEGDRVAVGPGKVLQHGRQLYAEHCQHCHGVTGNGNGPTAKYLNPLPRDYRLGKFKFTSTKTPSKAQRGDLARIIEDGIPGTYMPSFKLLTPEESAALVEYVLWLSMRGETEQKVVAILTFDYSEDAVAQKVKGGAKRTEVIGEFAAGLGQMQDDFSTETTSLAEAWKTAQQAESLVTPKSKRTPNSPESLARGRELFLSPKAKCAECHGEGGLGDGAQTRQVQPNRTEPGLFDDWGHEIRPRDLTTGIYRGGRRPVDLYRRIFAGIKGTPMTGFGAALTEEEIWDLVNYVSSIPFENRVPGKGAGPSTAPPQVATTHR